MLNNYYDVYIDNIIKLAKTLVIKSEVSALLVNERMKLVYGESSVDEYDRTSWKYYKHLCGQYHSTDDIIYVTSLDDLSVIPFNQTSFLIHTATLNAYQYGTRFYDDLVRQYPDMESLILGVLYPADMTEAIESEDGTILSYAPQFIESNETTLVHSIESWIKNYLIRWNVPSFITSDNYYCAAVFAQMSLNLVPVILNERLKRCKTPEAHSFHVYHYLESHNKLHEFIEHMNEDQIMYFYKNIAYLENNAGKNKTLLKLIDSIMSKRRFPISSFTVRQTTLDQIDNIKPTITFKRKIYNPSYENSTLVDYTAENIRDLQSSIAIDNDTYFTEHKDRMQSQYEYSLSSVIATKMIESSVYDKSDNSREEIMLNNWLYLSTTNIHGNTITSSTAASDAFAMLDYNVNFTHAINAQSYMLSVRDAYIYASYCYGRAIGLDMSYIPEYVVKKVAKLPKPTSAEIYTVVDEDYVETTQADEVIGLMPTLMMPITNITDFKTYCDNMNNTMKSYNNMASFQEHHYAVAQIKNMTARMFENKFISIDESPQGASTTLYNDWLSLKTLPTVDYEPEEYMKIYLALIYDAIGLKLDEESILRKTHRAMCDMMNRLNSYSVQLLSASSTGKQIRPTWSIIRVGNVMSKSKAKVYVVGPIDPVTDFRAKFKVNWEVVSNRALSNFKLKTTLTNKFKHIFAIGYKSNMGQVIVGKFKISVGMSIKASTPLSNPTSYNSSILTGIEYFDALSTQQQDALFDIYGKN